MVSFLVCCVLSPGSDLEKQILQGGMKKEGFIKDKRCVLRLLVCIRYIMSSQQDVSKINKEGHY